MKHNPQRYEDLREGALRFTESLRDSGHPFAFAYAHGCPPTMIGSALAACLYGLLGETDRLSAAQKQSWADHLHQFQDPRGLFVDPADTLAGERTPQLVLWRNHAHRTRHVLWALAALGRPVRGRLTFIDEYKDPARLDAWLGAMTPDLIWRWGNWVMDLGLFFLHEARERDDRAAWTALHRMLDFWDRVQDPDTGYYFTEGGGRRAAMAGAAHYYPLYWAAGRPVPRLARVVDATLSLQQPDGLFGKETGVGGGQCLDFDAVLILANAHHLIDHRRGDIADALARVERAILVNANPDGGFSNDRSDTPSSFASDTTAFGAREGGLWETYARLLTIALCSRVCPHSAFAGPWRLDHNLFEISDGGATLRQRAARRTGTAHQDQARR